jgi:putative ABC transport system substrate-binding protein
LSPTCLRPRSSTTTYPASGYLYDWATARFARTVLGRVNGSPKPVAVGIMIALGCLVFARSASAQLPPKVPRVGVLCPWICPTPAGERGSLSFAQKHPDNLMADEAFRLGLQDLGYIEGQNVVIEWRSAMGHYDRLAGLAQELVRLNVDVLVTVGAPWVHQFVQTHTRIPIVLAHVADPVMSGLVANLARPGGNITGLSLPSHELEEKQLELLKEVVPKLARVALLFNPDNPASEPHLRELQNAARTLSLEVGLVAFRGAADLDSVLTRIRESHAGALLLTGEPMILTNQMRLLDLARRARLPTVAEFRDQAELGSLITYGPNMNDMFRRAATFVDRILKGARPSDLPMEQPMRFELMVNLATARALGLTVPQAVLMRADRVIQ